MKVVNEVPKEIAQIYMDYPNIGRDTLIKEYGMSHHEARIYSWIMKNGKKIYHHDLKTKPESGKTKKVGILPDIHFPYHDERALDVAINYLLKVGVDVVVVLGDGVDCYAISFWKTDPTKPIFAAEVKQTIPLIKALADAFPEDTEKVWLEGNHELRLRNELWGGSKKLAGLHSLTITEVYKLKELGFNYVSNIELMQSDMQPFRIGKVYLLHGHEINSGWTTINIARNFYLKNPNTQIIGHFHRTQEHIQKKLDMQIDGSWSMGCLCNLTPDYRPANQWNHGVGIIEWDVDGYFSFQNKKIIDGRVL